MKTRTSAIPFGQIASMAAAITLLLGIAAGLHAVAADDVAQVTPPEDAMTKAAEGTGRRGHASGNAFRRR